MIEVINREILIPREEYNIGTCYDDNTETRHFHLKRVTSSGIDLAALTFNLDIQYADGNTDAASLVKEVTDKDINLVLTINNSMLQVPGTVLIQIRALDEDGVCKWTSYKSAFFVEDHINTPGHYEGDLTQLEQYEAEWGKVRDNVNQLNSRMDEVVKIHDDTPATEVEEEVIDGRVGYNGIQYDSLGTAVRQQIIDVREDMEEDTADWTEALAAEAAARTAADSTLQTNINSEASTRATQDGLLQTQIDQIIAPSGEAPSAAEVQNARIGADGITYDTLGNAIRGQVGDIYNDLKNHIIPVTGAYDYLTFSGIGGLDTNIYLFTGKTYTIKNVTPIDVTATGDARLFIKGHTDYVVDFPSIGNSVQFTPQYNGYLRMYNNSSGSAEAGIKIVGEIDSTVKQTTFDYYIRKGNLFNPNKYISGYYYYAAAETPTLNANSEFVCELIEIPSDKSEYIVNYKDYNAAAYDASYNLISTVAFTSNVPRFLPTGTKYLAVSIRYSHVADYMLLEKSVIPQEYSNFGVNVHDLITEKIYHVGKNDLNKKLIYPYHQLTPLLKSLENDDTPKTIFIHSGTYDIFEEYGGSEFISTLTGDENWSDVSVIIPPNTKIIGVGDVILSFEPTSSQIVNEHNAFLFSPLNVRNNVYLENLTLKGKNCRYCLHDESSGLTDAGTYRTYKNIRMIKTSDVYNTPQCYGAGFTRSLNILFESCDFTSFAIPWSIHNGTADSITECATITINDCYFYSGNNSVCLSFRNNATVQTHSHVKISNCCIDNSYNGVEVTASGNTSNPNSFDILMIGCNAVRGSEDVTPTNLYPIVQKNSIGTIG